MPNDDFAAARHSAPEHDTARHPLTVKDASILFDQLGVPRAPRSVQRFCEQGYLDSIRVKGAKGDQFFINRQSVERYAEELRQIDAIATMGGEARHDAPERDTTRNSAPERANLQEALAPPEREPETEPQGISGATKRLEDEILNLRIDNRAKEQVINFLTGQAREMQSQLQDVAYRLGSAERLVAQLEAPKAAEPEPEEPIVKVIESEPLSSPVTRSFLGRIFGK